MNEEIFAMKWKLWRKTMNEEAMPQDGGMTDFLQQNGMNDERQGSRKATQQERRN